MGSEGPPSLSSFALETEFWKRLGLRREDIQKRPAREIEEYLLYMQIIIQEEQAAQRRQSSGR